MKDKAELINHIIKTGNKTSYLELGVGYAMETISQIKCAKIVSVDMEPITDTIPSFKGTTDEFFKSNKAKFDVIYIDADHSEECVSRDFENAVKCLKKNGIILMHDVGPLRERDTLPAASGTAFKSFIKIRGDEQYQAFSYMFENQDVLGIVKISPNTNKLGDYKLDFNYYNANKESILQCKTVEELTNAL